jgi:hypothetical protein
MSGHNSAGFAGQDVGTETDHSSQVQTGTTRFQGACDNTACYNVPCFPSSLRMLAAKNALRDAPVRGKSPLPS